MLGQHLVFPAKRTEDGSYQRIMGFVSCFRCKDTCSFQAGGSGSTKHLLRHVCLKNSSLLSTENNQEGHSSNRKSQHHLN